MAAAEDLWCQGWSEPGAGSDLAAHHQPGRARRGAGGWRLTGQKTWTHPRRVLHAPVRAVPHRPGRAAGTAGCTYLLVPLDAPGVTVRGFGRLDGDEGFADVFFDDVVRARRRRARRRERGLAGGDGDDRLASAG